MSDLRQFKQALIEAGTPALRDAIYGREIDENDLRAELEYQLENRGFEIEREDDDSEVSDE